MAIELGISKEDLLTYGNLELQIKQNFHLQKCIGKGINMTKM